MLKTLHWQLKCWIIFMFLAQGNVNLAKNIENDNFEGMYLVSRIDCVCLRWTEWVQIGTPYNLYHSPQTYENLIKYGRTKAQLNKINVCTVPVSSDCRVLVPKLYLGIDFNQDFTACPYVLNSKASEDGHVEMRFLCWDGNCPCLQWSKWYNHDKPNDEGDLELLHHTITKHDWPCPQGTSPLDVECRTADGKVMSESNDKTIQCDLNGFRCFNDLQGDNCNCDDYMVKFLCMKQQLPDALQLDVLERDSQFNNCSRSNCPKENLFGRSRAPTLDARAESKNKLSVEIPASPKNIYGYGPCLVPLTCPRVNLIKLGRVFSSQRLHTKEKIKSRPEADCERNPNTKECILRRRQRQKREITNYSIYKPEYVSLVIANTSPIEHHREYILTPKVQSIKIDDKYGNRGISNRQNLGSRKKLPRWNHLQPSIHQTEPPYVQYHYNYPLMMPIQQQEMHKYYFSRNHQLPVKDNNKPRKIL